MRVEQRAATLATCGKKNRPPSALRTVPYLVGTSPNKESVQNGTPLRNVLVASFDLQYLSMKRTQSVLGPSWCAQHVGVLVLIMRLFRRSFASIGDFERRAATYWTSDRVQWLTNGKDVALAPDKPGVAPLLRVLGLLSPDGTMSDASMRKYAQLNAMHDAMERALAVPLQQGGSEPLRVVDMCTGSASHLALLLAFASRWRWERAVHVLAVDGSASRLKAAQHRAALLGIGPDVLQFKASTIRELPSWIELYSDAFPAAAAPLRSGGAEQSAPHGVFALHACDTATDEAAAYAVHARAHALVVAPCCQAELARSWRALAAPEQSTMRGGGGVRATRAAEEAKVLRAASPACSTGAGETRDHDDDDGGGGGGGGLHPFGPIHRSPSLRREMASTVTDAMRVLLLRASGYIVSVNEFVGTEHSPKNKLITATRQRPAGRGHAHRLPQSAARARAQAEREYRALADATGGAGVSLARMLGV